MEGPSSSIPEAPSTPFTVDGLHQHERLVWVPLRSAWVDLTHKPEELVRQQWIRRLYHVGGFSLEQMAQERRTHSGRRSPRADIVVWPSVTDKQAGREPAIVVETKADEGVLRPVDYWQGESYARAAGARFLVLANVVNSAVFELAKGLPGRSRQINDWPKLIDISDEARLNELTNRLEVFDREQFQRVLFDCHSLLRDNHAMTPDRAFDTISKVLFIKLHVERSRTHDTFTSKYLDGAAQYHNNPKVPLHEHMFSQTKDAYSADDLFSEEDRLGVSAETFRDLVGKLERFNLSKTSDDVKGIAFERFLGRTFRGELGQYFTPRPVVDAIIDMLDPEENELVCDPAAGSGGFLIRVFDHVREKIAAEIAIWRAQAIDEISSEYADDCLEEALVERDTRIEEAVEKINIELNSTLADGSPADTRIGRLAWRCIYGTDKEPRAARTAKMNMIMHGDGHGGIHWHDGLININGIFEGRFKVVVTNPPFGAIVNSSQRVGSAPESDVPDTHNYRHEQERRYGSKWLLAHNRVVEARGEKVLDQFEIGKGATSRKTEQMFLERCLNLLQPGGRLGIILPNGNLNASSQAWLRRWAEGKAFLRGVVALPPETFRFSGASVTASILIMQKFSNEDAQEWQRCWDNAFEETEVEFLPRRSAQIEAATPAIVHGEDQVLMDILHKLEEFGVARAVPKATRSWPTSLVRGAPTSSIAAPIWEGRNSSLEVRDLKRAYADRSTSLPQLRQAMLNLRRQLKTIDDEQTSRMWHHVRKSFDYQVFMATPKAVGITATGDTGDHVPNELPTVVSAWREFCANLSKVGQ